MITIINDTIRENFLVHPQKEKLIGWLFDIAQSFICIQTLLLWRIWKTTFIRWWYKSYNSGLFWASLSQTPKLICFVSWNRKSERVGVVERGQDSIRQYICLPHKDLIRENAVGIRRPNIFQKWIVKKQNILKVCFLKGDLSKCGTLGPGDEWWVPLNL